MKSSTNTTLQESITVLDIQFLYPEEDYACIQLNVQYNNADIEDDVEDFVVTRTKKIIKSVYNMLDDVGLCDKREISVRRRKSYCRTPIHIQPPNNNTIVTSQPELYKNNTTKKLPSNEEKRSDQLRQKAKSLLKSRNTQDEDEVVRGQKVSKQKNKDAPQADSTIAHNLIINEKPNNIESKINYKLQRRLVKIVKINQLIDELKEVNESQATIFPNVINTKNTDIEIETNILSLDISPLNIAQKAITSKDKRRESNLEGKAMSQYPENKKSIIDPLIRSSTSFEEINKTLHPNNRPEDYAEHQKISNFTMRNIYIRKLCNKKLAQSNERRIKKIKLNKTNRKAFTRLKARIPTSLNPRSQIRRISPGQHLASRRINIDWFKKPKISPYELPVVTFSENKRRIVITRSKCRGPKTEFGYNGCAKSELNASHDLNLHKNQRSSDPLSITIFDNPIYLIHKDSFTEYSAVEWGKSRLFKRIVDGHLDVWNAFSGKEFLSESEIRRLLSVGIEENQKQIRTVAKSTLFTLCGDLNIDCKSDPYDSSEVFFVVRR